MTIAVDLARKATKQTNKTVWEDKYELQRKIFFNITCNLLIYTMGHPDLTVSNFIGNSTQRVNKPCAFIVLSQLNTVFIFFQMDITRVTGPRVRVLLMCHPLQTPMQLAQELDLHIVIQMHQCKDMPLVSELF